MILLDVSAVEGACVYENVELEHFISKAISNASSSSTTTMIFNKNIFNVLC